MRCNLGTFVALLASAALPLGACANTAAWSIDGHLATPRRSLSAHGPGPGLGVNYVHSLGRQMRLTTGLGYTTFLTSKTPSYQVIPLTAGLEWQPAPALPFLGVGASILVAIESFRFRFAERIVQDDSSTTEFGPYLEAGYSWRRVLGRARYQWLLPSSRDAAYWQLGLGYRVRGALR